MRKIEGRVALIRGCHVIAKGNYAQVDAAIRQISSKGGLVVGPGQYGVGAYAFYINMVPYDRARQPLVIFDVEDMYVERKVNILPAKINYAFMLLRDPTTKNILGMRSYIPIRILGFVNVLNPLLKIYNGYIGII